MAVMHSSSDFALQLARTTRLVHDGPLPSGADSS